MHALAAPQPSSVVEYLESLQRSGQRDVFQSLYDDFYTSLTVFRTLPSLAKQFTMRLLALDVPVPAKPLIEVNHSVAAMDLGSFLFCLNKHHCLLLICSCVSFDFLVFLPPSLYSGVGAALTTRGAPTGTRLDAQDAVVAAAGAAPTKHGWRRAKSTTRRCVCALAPARTVRRNLCQRQPRE